MFSDDSASNSVRLPPTSGPTCIIATGGGKGGVGKSFISTSLGISLSQIGHSVTLVDLDLGAANVHTCLGGPLPERSISDFLTGRVDNLTSIVSQTPFHRLNFISGINDSLNIANLNPGTQERLMDELKKIPTEYLILDLGAGTNNSTLDFFLMADKKIVAMTPEPVSIENAYRFIKSAFFRNIIRAETDLAIQTIIEDAMDQKNVLGIRTPADLITHVKKLNPLASRRISECINNFSIELILNQIRARSDIDMGYSITSVCTKYFGVSAQYLGYLDHDNAVWQAQRKRKPLITEYPHSRLVAQFLVIAKNLAHRQTKKAVV